MQPRIELEEVCERFTENEANKRAFKFMIDTFGDTISYGVMKNISRNIKLFRLFQTSDCEKFMRIEDALNALGNGPQQKVLIHFTELNLYGMFTPDQYTAITNTLADKICDGANIQFHPKQIVLTGLPQKLVFICLGDENVVEKIRGYVEKKYKCGIAHVRTENRIEITVQGAGGNTYEETQKTYHDLFDFISARGDNATAANILPMPVIKGPNHNYVAADLSYDVSKPQDITDIINALKTLHGGNIVINMMIVNGNVGGNAQAGNVANYNAAGVDPYNGTITWIRNNLPRDKEVTTEYYARYIGGFAGTKLTNSQFGKLVREHGYKPAHGTNNRFWIKK